MIQYSWSVKQRDVDLEFSEAVISFASSADITAPNGTLATMTSSDNITWSETFTPTSNREDTTNTLSLATSYTDPAGNAGASATTSNYVVDTRAPTVSSVAITGAVGAQNNFVNAGDNVSVTVTFSEDVPVTGSPQLTLAIGSDSRTATYASGSGSTALVFQYTIQDGDTDTNGISIGSNALALNSGTIKDDAGNNATITHSSVSSNSSYKVDTTPPSVSSVAITSASGAQNNFVNAGDIVNVTTTFSENVNKTGSPQQTMVIGSTNRTAAYYSLSGSSMVFRYTIQAGLAAENDADGISFNANTLALNSGTISDPAGNNAILTHNSVAYNPSYMVDTIHPTVDSFTLTSVGTRDELLLVGQTAAVQLVFSEIIWSSTFHNSNDISVGSGSLSTMSSGNGITWNGTFTPSSNTEDTTNTLSLIANRYTDLAGNNGPAASTANYEVDTLAPSATFTFTDVYMKDGETSDVTLTFNEPVLDFSSADDITVPNLDNGTPSGTLATMTSSDNRTWTATFTPTFPDVQDWTNTLSLGTGYRDYDNNTGTAATSPNYMVDDIFPVENGTPTLTLSRPSLILYGQTATLTLDFPEPVTSSSFSSSSDINLDNASGSLSNMSSSNGGTRWTGTFTPTSNREVPSNTISLRDTWTDQVGNTGLTAITSSFEVETLRPYGTFSFSVTQGTSYNSNPALKPGDNASVTLSFNEEVFNFSSADDITHPYVNLSDMTSSDNITFYGSFTPMDDSQDYTNVLSLSGTFNDFKGNPRGSGSSNNYIVDTKAPTVTSMKLHDGLSSVNFTNSNICLPVHSNFKVYFDYIMEPSYITTSTSDSNCAGSIQVSSDNFSSCVRMSSEPSASSTSVANDTFTLNPHADLAYGTTYKIKVTTAAKDVLGNSLSSQYDHAYDVTTSFYPSSSPSSGFFVAVGAEGKAVRSINDGASWDNETCQLFTDLYGVASGNNTVVAVGQGGKIIRSTNNASSFSTVSPYYAYDSWGVTFGNNTFVGVSNSGRTGRSTNDGSSFSAVNSGLGYNLRGVAFGNNTFVAVAYDSSGRIVRSTNSSNGVSWSSRYTDSPRTYLYGITYGDSKFVAVGASGRTQRSSNDGYNWNYSNSGAGTTLNGVTFGNNTFVAVGMSGKIMTSSNGNSWTSRNTPISSELKGVAFGNNTFVAVGVGGKILRSTNDGVNWSDVTSPITTDLNGVTFSD
ncbi:MAG: Ig-like domain-containing protein [bacterium]